MTAAYTDELMAACDCAAGRLLQQEDVREAAAAWATTSLADLRGYLAGYKCLREAGICVDADVESLEIAIALRVERLGRLAALV